MRNAIMVGTRVYLRPVEVADGATLAAHTATETETFMYRGRGPMSSISFAHWVATMQKQQPPRDLAFAVCCITDDRCIGFVGVDEIDWVHRTGETFAQLGPDARGQGYGTEAKHLLLEYCFDRIHLHAIFATVFATNTRSMAALAKQGYRPAGERKWADVKDGVYRSIQYFDVLRDEWLAARDAWRATQPYTPPTIPLAKSCHQRQRREM